MNIKPLGLATALALAALATGTATAAEVGVSISISEPGLFGRIDIGRFPQPQVIYRTPVVVVEPPPRQRHVEPVYMWVPRDHRVNWRRHCAGYQACGVPVVFVRHDWYDSHVRDHGPKPKKGKGHGKDKHDKYKHGRGHHD